MKRTMISMVVAVAMILPATAMAQRVQPLPDEVMEVWVDNSQVLRVVPGSESLLEIGSESVNIAKVKGSRMHIDAGSEEVTLRLAPGRNISLHAEDYAKIYIIGKSAKFEDLNISMEDYSIASIEGTENDTLQCFSMRMHTEDFSSISSTAIIKYVEYDLQADDFSRINLVGIDQMPNPRGMEITTRRAISDFGKVYTGRETLNGEVVANQTKANDRDYTTLVNDISERVATAVNSSVMNKCGKKSVSWEFGGGDLDFAWGWHNWGNAMFTGFGGADGAAEVGTTFNNIQLHLNWTIARSRWLGFYAGLGLEWDKWKFATPSVTFNTAAEPYAFADAGASSGSMLLTTRYVIVPFTVRIGDTDGVHLELSAIPGIHWNASGLRSKEIVGNRTETVKDRSINKHLNPYKLDFRAALYYSHFGIYAQFSTQSVFKGNCEELFPVKFGFII